jgi:hypothetical protein
MAAAKLDIKRELDALNRKNYDFYSDLTSDEKKAFSPYILMRYTSSSVGDADIQEWFLERTNEYVNKDHWSLSKNHKELLWKLFAATGAGMHVNFSYLAAGKKEKVKKVEKLIAELYPAMKISEVKMIAGMMSKADIEELFDQMGFDKKQRKEYE